MNWLDAEIAARVGRETKDWEEREVAAFLKKQAERQEQFFTIGDFPVKRVYTAADIAGTPLEDIGLPGATRSRAALPHHVPEPHLDHAADRGLRHRRGHQPALQVPDRAGTDRHLDRLRHADADGL